MNSESKITKKNVRRSNSLFQCAQRAIRVKFFRNGDKYFAGFTFPISYHRYKDFEVLLKDLSSSNFCDKTAMPCGVRVIFKLGGSKIKSIHQMEEGSAYVASSNNTYIPLDYLNGTCNPKWKTTKHFVDEIIPVTPISVRSPRSSSRTVSYSNVSSKVSNTQANKFGAKIINLVRNSTGRPRQIFQWLLNCKTAPTFEKVLDDLSILLKLDSGCVRHIQTPNGREITSLADLFSEEMTFIAFGSDIIDRNDLNITPQEWFQIDKLKKPCPVNTKFEQKDDPNSGEPAANSIKSMDRYLIGNEIGVGNFAVVKECKDKKKNIGVAIKIIDKKKCHKNPERIEKEMNILKKLKHSNVLKMISTFESNYFIYLIMDLCKEGNMVDFLLKNKSYSEQDLSGMIHNIASGLSYLHSINILHRDVKFENILIDKDSTGLTRLRICDFGLAVELMNPEENVTVVCGSPHYMAPEILMQIGYSFKVDTWSLGVIFYILLSGTLPFSSESNDFNELFEKIMQGEMEQNPEEWSHVSVEAKKLLNCLMDREVQTRFKANDVLAFPWVAEDTVAQNENLWPLVGDNLVKFFNKSKLSDKNKTHICDYLANTALDKDSNYFESDEA